MKNRNRTFHSIRTLATTAGLALFLIGPLAGFAAAQDDGARKMSGAGFVLYVSLMRGH